MNLNDRVEHLFNTRPDAGETAREGEARPTHGARMTPADLTDAERADYEERAAIREYDGGMAREDAEAAALADVLRQRAQR